MIRLREVNMALTYDPSVFDVNDLNQAMRIILTPEGSTTEHRWEVETPYVAELIAQSSDIKPGMLLLDYGCGIGRLAKELILRHQCRVVGVDISPNMRALAVAYVKSDHFFTCPPSMLEALTDRGVRFDAAISIWVLQHCLQPADDIQRLRRALKPGAGIFVLNNLYRAIPTAERGWVNDGVDIKQLLTREFDLRRQGRLPADMEPKSLSELTYWLSLTASAQQSASA